MHDPERAAAVRAARAKGGQVRAIQGRRAQVDTLPGLVRFTGQVVQDVLDGTTEASVGRVVFYGISVLLRLVELSDLEQRIARLEARAEERDKEAHARWAA